MIEITVLWFVCWATAVVSLLQFLNSQTLRNDREYWRSNYLRLLAAYDQLHSHLERENKLLDWRTDATDV